MVGLHDAEVELTAADAVDVGHATATGRRIALDLVIGGAAIEETTNGLARHVVDAGLTTGAYGHEALLRLQRTTESSTDQGSRQGARQG
ncbi:hypothetical protein D3C84_1016420 [compost metagenome]